MAAGGRKEDDAIRKLFDIHLLQHTQGEMVKNQLWERDNNKKVKTEHDRYGFVSIIITI